MLSNTILNARAEAVNITGRNPIIWSCVLVKVSVGICGAEVSTKSMLVIKTKAKNKIEKGNGKYRSVCYF